MFYLQGSQSGDCNDGAGLQPKLVGTYIEKWGDSSDEMKWILQPMPYLGEVNIL